jgi:hypothetical protein
MCAWRMTRALATFAILGVASCAAVIDVSDVDAGCGSPALKACGGRCVRVDDPNYGCTARSCTPCSHGVRSDPSNAVTICVDNQCVDSCAFGFGCQDCTQDLLSDARNCGKCKNLCPDNYSCVCGECYPCGASSTDGGTSSGCEEKACPPPAPQQ